MRHGPNSILATVSGKQRKALLKREARWRATGDWGQWEYIPRRQFGDAFLGVGGGEGCH